MKKFWKGLLIALACLLAAVLVYAGYVFAYAGNRIGDQELTVGGQGTARVEQGKEYTVLSFNMGFGAYEADYGFFMDGGTESRAWSRERLEKNLQRIAAFTQQQAADLTLIQEVDLDATRSYHVDERAVLTDALGQSSSYTWAQNYRSAYLLYPITEPHGASVSGLLTFSRFPITAARRVELPVEKGVVKVLDLDRCYSVQRIPAGDRELVVYNLHLSAYTSDGTIANRQLELLLADMEAEYEKGNCCIAGGDFNKDLLGDSRAYFGEADRDYTWAQPIPESVFDAAAHIRLAAPFDEAAPVPSCRNADGPYHQGQYVLTVDGFLVSDNVEVLSAQVVDTGFAYSDHNPVKLTFRLP